MGQSAGAVSLMSFTQNRGRRRPLDREGRGGVNLYSLRDRDRAGNLAHTAAKFTGFFIGDHDSGT